MSGLPRSGFFDGKPTSDLTRIVVMDALFPNMSSSSAKNDERCAILAWERNGPISGEMGSMSVV